MYITQVQEVVASLRSYGSMSGCRCFNYYGTQYNGTDLIICTPVLNHGDIHDVKAYCGRGVVIGGFGGRIISIATTNKAACS